MEIAPVSRMEEVLRHALVRQPTPIVWEEDVKAVAPAGPAEEPGQGLVAH
jgi:ATP-dependent Lon protease